MIKIPCTNEQMLQMATNAVMASEPFGMGHIHYDARLASYTVKELLREDLNKGQLAIDYFQGRMVKFYARKDYDSDTWVINDPNLTPRIEYQSWAKRFQTYQELAESAGFFELPEW